MNILIYSFNDKIGDGLQKVTFLQSLKNIYPNSKTYYTTTHTTTFKNKIKYDIMQTSVLQTKISEG